MATNQTITPTARPISIRATLTQVDLAVLDRLIALFCCDFYPSDDEEADQRDKAEVLDRLDWLREDIEALEQKITALYMERGGDPADLLRVVERRITRRKM